jgi:hypothetical protein
VKGYIDSFERDVESDADGEEHAEALREGHDVAAIVEDIGGLESDPVSAS